VREDYGFTGKEEDVEVGLIYFGKRFLSPTLGRWVSPDPLAVHEAGKADYNLYAYVSGAVLRAIDPLGMAGEDAGAGGASNEPGGGERGAPSKQAASSNSNASSGNNSGISAGLVSTQVSAEKTSAAAETTDALIERTAGQTLKQRFAGFVAMLGGGAIVVGSVVAGLIMPSSERQPDASSGMTATPAEKHDPDSAKTQTGGADKDPPGKSPPTATPDEPGENKKQGSSSGTTLTAGKNFKEHFVSHRAAVEKALGTKVGKLKDGGGEALLKALGDNIDNGTLKFAGQGTLKKGGELMNIYRGNGLTVVTKPGGEWVTALKSGEGLDLAIRMLP
jgi:RHS repeat-associated protein